MRLLPLCLLPIAIAVVGVSGGPLGELALLGLVAIGLPICVGCLLMDGRDR